MRTRLRDEHDPTRPAQLSLETGGNGPDGAALAARGAALLDAADRAIARALSRDSAAYLAQNRQMGGQ